MIWLWALLCPSCASSRNTSLSFPWSADMSRASEVQGCVLVDGDPWPSFASQNPPVQHCFPLREMQKPARVLLLEELCLHLNPCHGEKLNLFVPHHPTPWAAGCCLWWVLHLRSYVTLRHCHGALFFLKSSPEVQAWEVLEEATWSPGVGDGAG